MLQRYKLRLRDGTVLAVDHDGLSTWLMDDKAMVQGARSKHWQPLKDFLAEERVLAKYAARKKAAARDDLPPPLPSAREHVAAPLPDPPPSERLGAPPVGELPPPDVPAAEPAVLDVEPAAAAPIPDPAIPPDPQPPSVAEIAASPADSSPFDPIPVPSISAPPRLLVLADDPALQPPEPARQRSPLLDELTIIPLKPLDDEPLAQAASVTGPEEVEVGTLFVEPPRSARFEGALRWLGSAFEALLAWWSDGLARLVRALAGGTAGEPTRRNAAGSQRGAVPVVTSISEPLTVQVLADELLGSPGSVEPDAAIPRARLRPPPALSELPVLRLAETDEPTDVGDVYEGEGLFRAGWRWTKRIVVITGLVLGGFFAGTTWETWFPRAIELGPMLFTEIDRQTGVSDPVEQQRRALEEASGRLPQLAPETIRRLLSGSPRGVLDPAELFRLASEAEARGVAALTPEESQELKALWRELLDGLTPAQRERVREYERARSRRATDPFEDRAALELFASAARALPPPSRARLQALSGKAVAAGLAPPVESAPRATSKR